MIVEMDLKGVFQWIVVDKDLVIIDPKYIYEYRTSVHYYVDKLLAV